MLQDRDRESLSFAELAQRIIAGDRAAADLLIRKYTEPCVGTLMIKCGFSTHTAHDITQDTILAVLTKLQSGELSTPDKRPMATDWLFTCLERNGIDHLRGRAVQRHHEGAALERITEEVLVDPDTRRPISILDERERAELAGRMTAYVREEIQKATGKTRQILDLFLAGKRMVDIAQELGMNPDRCQNYFALARDRIVAHAHARALGINAPEPQPVTRDALSDTFSRLPAHQRKIARLACFDGFADRPDEIARITGYKQGLVETNLAQIWRLLSRRYHRDFPAALELLESKADPGDARPPAGEAQ